MSNYVGLTKSGYVLRWTIEDEWAWLHVEYTLDIDKAFLFNDRDLSELENAIEEHEVFIDVAYLEVNRNTTFAHNQYKNKTNTGWDRVHPTSILKAWQYYGDTYFILIMSDGTREQHKLDNYTFHPEDEQIRKEAERLDMELIAKSEAEAQRKMSDWDDEPLTRKFAYHQPDSNGYYKYSSDENKNDNKQNDDGGWGNTNSCVGEENCDYDDGWGGMNK